MHQLTGKNVISVVARFVNHGMFVFLVMENLKPVIGATGEEQTIGASALDATAPEKSPLKRQSKTPVMIITL